MGLDNGITVKATSRWEAIQELDASFSQKYNGSWEVCYWRKCWNVRNDIFSVLACPRENNDGQYPVQLEHIDQIIDVLKSYNEDNWELSIWEFEEMKPHLKEQAKNLKKLKKLMEIYPLSVYFYDSY